MSLIQSAKLNAHDPYVYLKDVLNRLPTQPAGRIEELLPIDGNGRLGKFTRSFPTLTYPLARGNVQCMRDHQAKSPDMRILSEVERQAIRAGAEGERSQLDSARRAFHRAVPRHGVASCVELQFMSEVPTPSRTYYFGRTIAGRYCGNPLSCCVFPDGRSFVRSPSSLQYDFTARLLMALKAGWHT